ncbi:GNAT family N-acetyltransferase [Chitinivorax sp. B]|uniref:GNAT family N-acetyltransferase n=1 Tax=Chitinivorax sp. B TaxID=2502235 RepID=UPI0010F4E51E|nr:GNAT family N-acetyltransferase [Chitinivorax sp. B]
MHIIRLSATALREAEPQLINVLIDTVANDASIGFLAPLDEQRARTYFRSLEASVTEGSRWIWVALIDGLIVGTVQLDLCQRENGRSRAEIQKLLVLSDCRRRGIASALMETVEDAARLQHRKLLYLDTETDSPAETFYREPGYEFVGRIPDYASSPDGTLHPTSLYYKRLVSEYNR